ncbi:MAG TPA: His/Gly/Thr/Pro-type tRNA ligase C-terminal domain-containing protein, partial [Candidatus Cloacimonas sp.]|nr:His/Gly/Thr/Pro-type tRNA ligase C-terminal domain-containing protein [Candidatus Cloacimonas sp.]
ALEEENIDLASAPKPDAYFVCVGENTRMQILPYLNALRTKGLLVDYDPDKNSLKAQLKAADASGAKYAIIIGENELAAKTVNLKNMQTGEQITIPMDAEQTIKRMRGF